MAVQADKPADGFQGRSTGFGSVTCRSDSTIFRGFYVRSCLALFDACPTAKT